MSRKPVQPEDVFGEDPLDRIFERHGLTRDVLARFFAAKLEATETKFFQHLGEVTETRDVDAHDIQLRAGIEVAKMLRMYPDRINVDVTFRPVEFGVLLAGDDEDGE